jgi:hypothetical protein
LFLFALVLAGCILAVVARRAEPFLRARLVQGLQERFRTRVELDHFHVALGNGMHGEWGIWATGQGLRIWPPHRTGGDHPLETAVQSQPLIQLAEFRFHVPLRYERGKATKISLVRLIGLDVHVPPRSEREKQTGFEAATTKPSAGQVAGAEAGRETGQANGPSANSAQPGTGQPSDTQQNGAGILSTVVVERIQCDHAQLTLETEKPDKLPVGFAIAALQLRHVAAGGPMEFDAELTNPRPRGVIHTTGSLGPWLAADPGETALSGTYRFDHADLATFKGIGGILSSTGRYQGTLRDIVVDGEAHVPDFHLTHFGNALPLHTQFHARVDGTDGDTWLDSVDATLGHSHFTTRGQIVRMKPAPPGDVRLVSGVSGIGPSVGGHDIKLQVDVDHGHIEDFLLLANRAPTPLLTGTLNLKASLHIPPGKDPVHERMTLDGFFKLDRAHFTSAKIQDRIQELSLRGQGRPGDLKTADANAISSEMQGNFHMAKAIITLPDLQYNVPGAAIELNGTYALEGSLNFAGTARMQATVSKMVGGWKGFLLKPADRFFKKDGAGTLVPIQIKGPHDAPEFGVDLGRMKKTSPEKPGQKEQ